MRDFHLPNPELESETDHSEVTSIGRMSEELEMLRVLGVKGTDEGLQVRNNCLM
jgi:hypothetical protein